MKPFFFNWIIFIFILTWMDYPFFLVYLYAKTIFNVCFLFLSIDLDDSHVYWLILWICIKINVILKVYTNIEQFFRFTRTSSLDFDIWYFLKVFLGVSLGTILSISFNCKFGAFFQFQNLQAYVHTYITHFPMLQKVYMCVGYGERCHMFEPLWKWNGWNMWRPKGTLHSTFLQLGEWVTLCKPMLKQVFGTTSNAKGVFRKYFM
jgi:hypothetical protein